MIPSGAHPSHWNDVSPCVAPTFSPYVSSPLRKIVLTSTASWRRIDIYEMRRDEKGSNSKIVVVGFKVQLELARPNENHTALHLQLCISFSAIHLLSIFCIFLSRVVGT